MIGRRISWAALVAVTVGSIACNEPCQALAERTCKQVGESDPQCLQLEAIAAEPRAGDKIECEAGNEFIDQLRRGG